jgi:hypothetical protein
MAKQSKPIRKLCESRKQCARSATWGVYAWAQAQTDVNLDRPLRVFCGQHKVCLDPGVLLRNVRLRVS